MIDHLLNRQLEVWRPTTTTDAGGGQQTTWVNVATVPARLSAPSAGNERDTGQASQVQITHDVYLLPGAPVQRGDELREDDLALDVVSLVEPSKPAYLKAKCTQDQVEGVDREWAPSSRAM